MVDLTGFEPFVKGVSTRSRKPTVTLQRRGIISFNPAAFEALGSPEAVELLYSAERRVIAVRPVDAAEVSHAVMFRKVAGKNTARTQGAMLIAAIAFCQAYDIDTTESVRRDVEVVDNVALIDLNDPGVIVRGRGGPRGAVSSAGDSAGESDAGVPTEGADGP